MTTPKANDSGWTSKQKAQVGRIIENIRREGNKPSRRREPDPQSINLIKIYVSDHIEQFLTDWRIEAENAINRSTYPVPQHSRAYFFLALAGNLIWASTSLLGAAQAMATEAKALAAVSRAEAAAARSAIATGKGVTAGGIDALMAQGRAAQTASVAGREAAIMKAMSFGGAVVGGGAIEQASPPEEGPAGEAAAKEKVSKQIALARGLLEEIYKREISDWTRDIIGVTTWEGGFKDGVLDHVQSLTSTWSKYIWDKMFAGIKFDSDRFDNIRMQMINTINGVIADYNRQLEEFNQAYTYEGEGLRRQRGHIFGPRLRFVINGKLFGPPLPAADGRTIDTKFH
jgi:hypothetical protein